VLHRRREHRHRADVHRAAEKRTDGGVRRRRQPSTAQQKLRRTS
jgi:hypothetical protein